MTKQTIKIPLLNGTIFAVEAEVVGDLALHARYRKADAPLPLSKIDQFSITHIPTLLNINSAIPDNLLGNKTKLLKWMELVQQDLKKDWMMLRKSTPIEARSYPEKTEPLRLRIRTHCLTITKV